jgi:hypothetical protein
MRCIFDKRGEIVGWLGDEGTVYDTRGNPRAFLREHHVYSFNQSHRGIYQGGYFRDREGRATAFTEDAYGEPALPTARCNRIPPKTVLFRRPRVPEAEMKSPAPRNEWSEESFDMFIGINEAPACF